MVNFLMRNHIFQRDLFCLDELGYPFVSYIISFGVYRYPEMTEGQFAKRCPFCRKKCNCNVCLHSSGLIKVGPVLMSVFACDL
jgi:hypothetical protein